MHLVDLMAGVDLEVYERLPEKSYIKKNLKELIEGGTGRGAMALVHCKKKGGGMEKRMNRIL